jgi:hypothetical protein
MFDEMAAAYKKSDAEVACQAAIGMMEQMYEDAPTILRPENLDEMREVVAIYNRILKGKPLATKPYQIPVGIIELLEEPSEPTPINGNDCNKMSHL